MKLGTHDLYANGMRRVVKGTAEVLSVNLFENVEWIKGETDHFNQRWDEAIIGTVEYKLIAKGCHDRVRTSNLVSYKRYRNEELQSHFENIETFNNRYRDIVEFILNK